MSAGSDTVHERLAAVKAAVELLAGVRPLVPGNSALLAEPHRTHRASVGLLSGVGPLVRRNVAFPGEAPWAHRAENIFICCCGVGRLGDRKLQAVCALSVLRDCRRYTQTPPEYRRGRARDVRVESR